MAKTKRRHLAAIAAKKDILPMDNKQRCPPFLREEMELEDEEESWVEVRKQRVIILIPPLPTVTQASTQVERMKQTEAVSRPFAKGTGRISRKRSRIDSTGDAKNASGNIRKVILQMQSWQKERVLGRKSNNSEGIKDILASQHPEPKSTGAPKSVTQGTSKLGTRSTTRKAEALRYGEREAMPMQDMTCQTISQDNLQVPHRKVSRTSKQQKNSSEHAVLNKWQRREILSDSAAKLEMENQCESEGKGKTGNQCPLVEDATLLALQRNSQNEEEAQAVRSSDPYPQAAGKLDHPSPAPRVQSDSNLLGPFNLQQTSSMGLDGATVCLPMFPSKNFLEHPCLGYNPGCMMPSLQHSNKSLVSDSKVMACEKISSASIHMKANEGTTTYTNAIRETNNFGSNVCVEMTALDYQTKRALLLRRNLEKAGGLSRWLISQGLGQFVEIFQREKIEEFQLLQLTMGTLKEMGTQAVGPRRKLIHAIDCLSQPFNFRAF